jgi:hypothetical protein
MSSITTRRELDAAGAEAVLHSVVLAPGLLVNKVYVGYWFWGCPTPEQLWADLGDLFRRAKPDFDPTTAEARAGWAAAPAG